MSEITQPDQTTRAEMFWFAFRRILLSPLGLGVGFVLLIILFYAVEDWRGKRAWRKCKAEFEARGEHLDWSHFVPPTIPDEENFFKAPRMKEWFQKNPNRPYTKQYPYALLWPTNDATWSERMETEPVIHAPNGTDYPASVLTNWFETEYAEEFEILRAACQRPKARLDGDHSAPWSDPIPDFVNLRQAAQILAARAQAYLQKGRPDLALQDLTMIRRLMDCLQPSPSLVSAMIRVAIGGLYVSSIHESLAGNNWSDAQLKTIEQQLRSMDFLPELDRSFRAEVAATVSYADAQTVNGAANLFGMNWGRGRNKSAWDSFQESIEKMSFQLVPRGWIYQNMVVYTRVMADHCWTDMDLKRRRIFPKITANNADAIESAVSRRGPFHFLVAFAVPNFIKAKQTMARNQAAVQMASLACALERYKRSENRYPEKLDDLVPRFIEKLPRDLVSGEPPVYRRLEDGKFLLYSVGWDQVDDGGEPVPDWVWPDVANWK